MKQYFKKKCAKCQIVKIPQNRIYCGSERRRKGCSYIAKLERQKRWRIANPDCWKKQEEWRHRVGFYKRKNVIERRRERQREYYKIKSNQ